VVREEHTLHTHVCAHAHLYGCVGGAVGDEIRGDDVFT
jgi:hypothetical protein